MLTNWMSICMYSYLQVTVGKETPFLLPSTIRVQKKVQKKFMDAITGKVHYTLNEWLLHENIKAKPQNLNMSFQSCCCMDSLSKLAMDTDMLTQLKEKILEIFCKNIPVPYSQ